MNKISVQSGILLGLAFVNFIAFIVAFCMLPESVPVHININMEVDRIGSPYWLFILAFLPILINIGMICELLFSKQNQKNKKVFHIIMTCISLLFIWMGWSMYALMTTGAQLGEKVNISMSLLVMLPLGLLFLVMGNYMPKIRQNRTLGIKLPWTIKNEECWRKTHIFGGYLMIIAGLIVCIGAIICGALNIDRYVFIFFGVTMLMLFIAPTVYAKITYDKLTKNPDETIISTTASPYNENEDK